MNTKRSYQGVVVKSTGSLFLVETSQGVIQTGIKGKFRIQGLKTTNPVAVGDHVELTYKEHTDQYVIHKILPRKNYLIRKSVNLSKQYHILATNVDQCLIMASIRAPKTSFEFVDRLLVSAEAYNIKTTILLNKVDLLNEEDEEEIIFWQAIYSKADYEVIPVSMTNKEGLAEISNLVKNKTTVISGHSGAGKSTLLNALNPKLELKTLEVSEQHEQGKHTTTFAEMFDIPGGGKIIDTPGIRGLGVVDIEKEELNLFFPDFLKYKSQCKFSNCMHLEEPKCAVKEAIEEGKISITRYESYLSILELDQSYR